ncbi:nuclear transport factor 2 family protein [uncultured Microbacterium sp.]|uniref:nuclear transport factor 2 family protein n=1 Tax=uncultured Microbacterium sp. TaxID=191216 RepID=UPI0028E59315|nr:nuclear transport factor 2 family protein [uncultured Microbacterium sp.]
MTPSDVIARYGAAAAVGDMAALAATLHEDAVWHQPGRNQLSGDHVGPDAIVAHLGRFMELSGGTFRLETLSVVEAGALVATTVKFSATRDGHPDLDQSGVDIFRVQGDRIAEIWLISEDQETEDAFWG